MPPVDRVGAIVIGRGLIFDGKQLVAFDVDQNGVATDHVALREDWQDYADDHNYYGPGYYGGYGYGGTVAGAAVAGAALGAAAGAAAAQPYYSLPCSGAATVVVGSTTYYQCGSTWYIRAYSGGNVAYTIVNPPAGY